MESRGQADPYPTLFEGKPNYAVLKGFPWDKLQFLPMHYKVTHASAKENAPAGRPSPAQADSETESATKNAAAHKSPSDREASPPDRRPWER